ncbi:Uncharacterised protein [Clostridioides difficile]|nr:Uncharacterised protein [Clostridioides difficile]
MKTKFIKSTLLALALVTSINFGVVQSVYAASNSAAIPTHAEPGTRIEYDKNNNMDILKGKIDETDSTSSDNSLPKPQPGMTVSYDGTGEPVFIKVNGKPYIDSEKTKEAEKNMSRSSYYEDSGAISWYDDKYGQSDHKLKDYDCATDMYSDNCALGTRISVQDRDSGIWGNFKKWDVGNLKAQSEPRIIDVWDLGIFEDVFQLDDGEAQGLIHNGYYYHY